MTREPLLAIADASVRYGPTAALDRVTLELAPGEIHAVVGENGAGKSTLLRVLAGDQRIDGGTRCGAAPARVAWVPQEPLLPPDLDVTSWVFLGAELRNRWRVLRRAAMRAATAAALETIGCRLAPRARLGALGATERKQVQLARALRARPDVLLLDEPTAVLGAADAAHVFAMVRATAARGGAVCYVSHRLDEVLALATRVTVLRDGRRVWTRAAAEVCPDDIVRAMVGRSLASAPPSSANLGSAALTLTAVSIGPLRDVSLAVRAGEIVGLAGLIGAGRSALLEAIARLRRIRGGRIAPIARPVLVASDRHLHGLVPTLSVRENLFLPAPAAWLRPRQERRVAAHWAARLGIRCSGVDAAVQSLSGGNQQKLMFARALRHRPRLLLLDEPTAGVDIAAKAEIHDIIRALAADGTAVLLASSDLPELLSLCDRIAVLAHGRCAGIMPAAAATEERIAALMTADG